MRTIGSAWETWTVPAADSVCCARVRWEIHFLITVKTARIFCKCPVLTYNYNIQLSDVTKSHVWGRLRSAVIAFWALNKFLLFFTSRSLIWANVPHISKVTWMNSHNAASTYRLRESCIQNLLKVSPEASLLCSALLCSALLWSTQLPVSRGPGHCVLTFVYLQTFCIQCIIWRFNREVTFLRRVHLLSSHLLCINQIMHRDISRWLSLMNVTSLARIPNRHSEPSLKDKWTSCVQNRLHCPHWHILSSSVFSSIFFFFILPYSLRNNPNKNDCCFCAGESEQYALLL
jgi:hypothetical protein